MRLKSKYFNNSFMYFHLIKYCILYYYEFILKNTTTLISYCYNFTLKFDFILKILFILSHNNLCICLALKWCCKYSNTN